MKKKSKDLQAQVKDPETLVAERNNLLDQLERAYHNYYDVRKEKYKHLTILSDGKLQLDLNHAADRTAYEEKLVELLKGGAGCLGGR